MKNNKSKSVVLVALAFIAFACSPSYKYINPSSINLALCDIDSTVASLKGYGTKAYPELDSLGLGAPSQEAYDIAKNTWTQFETFCFKRDYKGAYGLFNEEEKPGDFLVYLKHSSARYKFDTDVLRPIIYEYEQEDVADSLYIKILETEYWLENGTMRLGAGNIPDPYPVLVTEFGCLLSKVGRIDDAFGLLEDFAYAVKSLTGDLVFTYYKLTLLIADFHSAAGNVEAALKTLEDYKAYSAEHMSTFREEKEYKHYMSLVDKRMSELKK